jgi:catechol 2,3-dioxygenase-like lactoylglutathione lyase family enzyme
MHDIAIAHVTIEVRRPARFRAVLAELTGSPAPPSMLRVTHGRSNDLALLGLAFPSEDRLMATAARLTAAGVLWERVPGPTLTIHCVDPARNRLELAVVDDTAAAPPAWPVGHVALTHRDHAALEHFYNDVIGLRLNEQIRAAAGPIELHGSFLGSAHRHHTIAVLNLPSRRRLHHVFLAAPTIGEVELGYAAALAARVPMSMELGQHSQPDGTTSFYASSPCGFDVEIGAGGNVLDGRDITAPLRGDSTSSWGHTVTMRARLRVARALALQRLGL